MIIGSSDIQMASKNMFSAKSEKTENLEIWKGKRPERSTNANADNVPGAGVGRSLGNIADRVSLSSERPMPKAYGHVKQDSPFPLLQPPGVRALQTELRLPNPGRSHHNGQCTGNQSPPQHFVEFRNSGRETI